MQSLIFENKLSAVYFWVPTVLLGTMLLFTIFGEKGLLQLREISQNKTLAEERLISTRAENEKLKGEIVALNSNRRYVEKIARDTYGLVHKNEVVYQFPTETPTPERN